MPASITYQTFRSFGPYRLWSLDRSGNPDIVLSEHAIEMFRLVGGGEGCDLTVLPKLQHAVLPGTTHVTYVDSSDWLILMITEFLDAPMPE